MAASNQIKALIKSFSENDVSRFYSTAMQIAASEAKKGHKNVAHQLRKLIDEAKQNRSNLNIGDRNQQPTPISRPKGELSDLLEVYYPKTKIRDMVLKPSVSDSLYRIIEEQRKISILHQHDLDARRKVLLLGHPGCGKSMTAEALAGELNLPIMVVRLDGLITKFMGESIAKLRQIFDEMKQNRGVYLFDEFDSIGVTRSYDNEVGEMKRVLNSFLINIENDNSNSLVIAASNRPEALDKALYRRFDDIIKYDLPDKEQIKNLITRRLKGIEESSAFPLRKIVESSQGHSHADIVRACDEAIKDMLLSNRKSLNGEQIINFLSNRL